MSKLGTTSQSDLNVIDHSCDRKLEIDPCIQGSKLWVHMGWKAKSLLSLSVSFCDPDPYSAGPLPRLSHSMTTCSIHTHCGQNRRTWIGHKTACVCLCVCAYMQPQQSLLLHRRRVARESAADEAKHFLHGEGQGAQLNIEHLTVSRRQNWMWHPSGNVAQSVMFISLLFHSLKTPKCLLLHLLSFSLMIHLLLISPLVQNASSSLVWEFSLRRYLSTSRNSLSWWSGTSVRMASSHSGIKHSHSGWLMTL